MNGVGTIWVDPKDPDGRGPTRTLTPEEGLPPRHPTREELAEYGQKYAVHQDEKRRRKAGLSSLIAKPRPVADVIDETFTAWRRKHR